MVMERRARWRWPERCRAKRLGQPGPWPGNNKLFAGPVPATDYHISFVFPLPGDSIDYTASPFAGGFNSATRFDVCNPGCVEWSIGAGSTVNQVNFIAPAGSQLNPGDPFFVNVIMNRGDWTAPTPGSAHSSRLRLRFRSRRPWPCSARRCWALVCSTDGGLPPDSALRLQPLPCPLNRQGERCVVRLRKLSMLNGLSAATPITLRAGSWALHCSARPTDYRGAVNPLHPDPLPHWGEGAGVTAR